MKLRPKLYFIRAIYRRERFATCPEPGSQRVPEAVGISHVDGEPLRALHDAAVSVAAIPSKRGPEVRRSCDGRLERPTRDCNAEVDTSDGGRNGRPCQAKGSRPICPMSSDVGARIMDRKRGAGNRDVLAQDLVLTFDDRSRVFAAFVESGRIVLRIDVWIVPSGLQDPGEIQVP